MSVLEVLDLIIFTGPDSPAYGLSSGTGNLNATEQDIPWLSLAARGNGLARIFLSFEDMQEIYIRHLLRGDALESPVVMAMGDSYMEDLITSALAAAKVSRASDRGESDFKPT